MDFFEAQDRADRATWALVVFYALAILSVVLATDAVVSFAIAIYSSGRGHLTFAGVYREALPIIGVAVTVMIGGASLSKANELRGGGTVFAAMLGARFLPDNPLDPAEVRLKNVVDEMALAAGVKSPAVCVLDNEPRINAFAAGTNNVDPVIGVTAGCLNLLTREELQAVAAHEFSHILRHDTTLNTRAYSLIFGLLAISAVGANLISAATDYSDRYDRRGGGDGMAFVIGLLLIAIGSLGAVAGRAVRAAIVRQREFLADAAAVQYTRNAGAVAQAIYKMGTTGSHLKHMSGDEVEHFLFGAGGSFMMFGPLKTHPSPGARIKDVCPGFQPTGRTAVAVEKLDVDGFGVLVPITDSESIEPSQTDANSITSTLGRRPLAVGTPLVTLPATVGLATALGESAGSAPIAVHVPPAPPRDDLGKVPSELLAALADPERAAVLCYALAAADTAPSTWSGLVLPHNGEEANVYASSIKSLPLTQRMALLDSLIPSLQKLPNHQCAELTRSVAALLKLTAQPDLIAVAASWRLQRYLEGEPLAGPKASTWSEGAVYLAILLGTLARLQCGRGLIAHKSYDIACLALKPFGPMPPLSEGGVAKIRDIHIALTVLASASAATRDVVVAAAGHIVALEQIPEPRADLMLRLICDAADCDVPDFVGRWV